MKNSSGRIPRLKKQSEKDEKAYNVLRQLIGPGETKNLVDVEQKVW